MYVTKKKKGGVESVEKHFWSAFINRITLVMVIMGGGEPMFPFLSSRSLTIINTVFILPNYKNEILLRHFVYFSKFHASFCMVKILDSDEFVNTLQNASFCNIFQNFATEVAFFSQTFSVFCPPCNIFRNTCHSLISFFFYAQQSFHNNNRHNRKASAPFNP